MDDIKLYKLITGEEIVARIQSQGSNYVEIVDAVSLVYHRAGEDKMSVGFAPFMPYSGGVITLRDQMIGAESDVGDQLRSEYNRVFSRIQIAPASALSSRSRV